MHHKRCQDDALKKFIHLQVTTILSTYYKYIERSLDIRRKKVSNIYYI
jgi:hypothetical protein